LGFSSPERRSFLSIEKETNQRIQGFTHFLTPNQLFVAKQAPTPPYGRQTRPLFLTLQILDLPKLAKAIPTSSNI
jgi:hypothetical protein